MCDRIDSKQTSSHRKARDLLQYKHSIEFARIGGPLTLAADGVTFDVTVFESNAIRSQRELGWSGARCFLSLKV